MASPSRLARASYRRAPAAGGVRVVVEGLNIAKRHTKPRQRRAQRTGMPQLQQGGILDIAQPLADQQA